MVYINYFTDRANMCTDGDSNDCSRLPHTSSYYKDEVTALIIKGVVIFIAVITQLLVAILIIRRAIMVNSCKVSKRLRIFQIIFLWNMFLFVQIWVGLVLLPACIFLIIAPLQTIPILCAALATPPLLMLFIVSLLWLQNQLHIRNFGYKINALVCIHFFRNMILVALIIALMVLYFHLSPGGTTLSSTGGIIFSLFPSIMLSLTVWGIKRRFFSRKPKKARAEVSVSTEQEDIQGRGIFNIDRGIPE